MFQWNVVWQNLFSPLFLQAMWTTLWLSVVAQLLGVIIGLFLAILRMSRNPILNLPARFYIWLFRGSPLLVQVYILFTGIPEIFHDKTVTNFLSAYVVILIAFSLNEGAYMAEIIRAGIDSVDTGQMEAAKALGMRYTLAMRRIVLPQAARVVVPPLGNEFNNMLKTTSIASIIGVQELTGTATSIGSISFTSFELLIVATFYYLILTTLWGYAQRWIENRLDPNRTNSKIEIDDKKNWTQRMVGFGTRTGGGTLVGGR